MFNGVITKSSFADTHFFVGRGAGAHPTASAVLSDVSALSYNYQYEYKKINRQENLELSDDVTLKVFLRHRKEDAETLKQSFATIEEAYTNHDSGYITGNITLENLKTLQSANAGDRSFVLLQVVAAAKDAGVKTTLAAATV